MLSPFLARNAERLTWPVRSPSRKLPDKECLLEQFTLVPALIARKSAARLENPLRVFGLIAQSSWLMTLGMARNPDRSPLSDSKITGDVREWSSFHLV